jgi:nicotinamidase/pyrazinamidase
MTVISDSDKPFEEDSEHKMSPNRPAAVIVVDIQADFTEYRNGSLAVPGTGEDYIDLVLSRTREYKKRGLPILATRDFHPPDHVSFFTNHPGAKPFQAIRVGNREQVLWPPHCVQGTPGAEILLPRDLIATIISKGDKRTQESYSGFRDDSGRETGLKALLHDMGATSFILYGIATDYCVRATTLHALEEGFAVTVPLGLSRGVTSDGTRAAVEEIRARGATVIEE